MARLLKTRNATDPKTGKTIQHALYDLGWAYAIYRWDEETGENELIDETSYEGQADSKAARFVALGELSSLHLQALHDIHGETYINKRGIKMYWADAIGRYVTIPDND